MFRPVSRSLTLRLLLAATALLLGAQHHAGAAPKKKPNPVAPRNALSMTPGLWKFAIKGGFFAPREGALDAGPVLEGEVSRALNRKNRVAFSFAMAFGDIPSAPGFERESQQKYLHFSYLHQSNDKNPMGQFYYGGGLSWGQQRAVAGGRANGAGVNVLGGYVWRSGFLVETRYTTLESDKNTSLGGLALSAGYAF